MYDPSSPFTRSETPFKPGQKSDFAEERLRAAIQWCELEPGEMVAEQDLVSRFGLGRAGTRAALGRLAACGLVEAIPRAGWRIQPISGALIGHVIEARKLAEPMLKHAEATSQQKARYRELLDILGVLGGHQDEDEILSSSRQYEREALDMALTGVNPLVGRFLADLRDQSDRIVRFLEKKGGRPFPVGNIPDLLQAVIAGDSEAIVRQRLAEVGRFETFVIACLLRDDTAIAPIAHDVGSAAGKLEKDSKNTGNLSTEWEKENGKYLE